MYWRRVDLQGCAHFCCTAKWFSYTCIFSFITLITFAQGSTFGFALGPKKHVPILITGHSHVKSVPAAPLFISLTSLVKEIERWGTENIYDSRLSTCEKQNILNIPQTKHSSKGNPEADLRCKCLLQPAWRTFGAGVPTSPPLGDPDFPLCSSCPPRCSLRAAVMEEVTHHWLTTLELAGTRGGSSPSMSLECGSRPAAPRWEPFSRSSTVWTADWLNPV